MAKQVSHHPAISAYYTGVDGCNIYLNTIFCIKISNDRWLDFGALRRTYITYDNFDDVNAFIKPKEIIRNLVLGILDIDVVRKFQITNEMGNICEVDMIASKVIKKVICMVK